MKRRINIRFFLYCSLTLLSSCDFSSQLHKEILLAQESIGQQKYEESILRYKNILKQYPPKIVVVKTLYQLGDLYSIHMGEPKTAVKYFTELKEATEDPTWLVKAEEKLGEIHFAYLKDYKSAAQNYLKLVNFRPVLEKHDFYEYRLGLCYTEENNQKEGLQLFSQIGRDPGHEYFVPSFYHLGMLYFQNKQWKEAVSYWLQFISKEKRKDNIIQVKFLMGNAYETMEKLEEAYDIYYSLLGEYPNTEVVKNRLKSLYTRRMARKR